MFGAGGGGFGTSGTGFGTSTPFGSSTTTQQPSAFGTGGATFGAGTTSAFGAKPAFGSTSTTGAFGSTTSTFGAKPSVFGAPAAAPATTFGAAAPGTSAFGRTTSTSPFGAAPAATTGAFGATTSAFGAAAAPASPFGAPAPAAGLGGAFGSTTAAANPFGKPATSPFGAVAAAPAASGVFGAPAPAGGGFGGFGTASTPTAGGGLFGATPAPAAGAFGAPAPAPTGGLFGAAPASTGLGGFGAPTSAFGAAAATKQGTGNPPWRETRAEDPTGKAGANPGMLMSISAMKEYEGKSHEELRVEDYLQNRKNSSAVSVAPTGFGAALGGTAAPAAGIFGGFGGTPAPAAASSGFGFGAAAPPAPSSFGGVFGSTTPAPAAGAFGGFGVPAAPAPATSLFGAPAPAQAQAAKGAFGAPAPAPAAGFGFGAAAAAPAPGGFGLFGTTPAAAPAAGGFGAAAAAPASTFGFGAAAAAPAPAAGGFGSTIPGFGAPAAAPATGGFGFGAAQAPAAAGAFGAPSPAPAPSLFGAGGGLFGSAAAAAPAASVGFGFGAKPAAAPTATPGAGGFSFGGAFGAAAKPATGAFGAPTPAAGVFGAAAPAPASGGFSFGGAAAPAPATLGGFGGFGGGFGASASAPTATSAFGAPVTGSIFGAPAPASGAGGVFGATTQEQQQQQLQQQQQHQQRVAFHNQDPYGASGNAGFGSGALEQKIKGVQNSSQQLAISFTHNNAPSSGVGASDGVGVGGGGGSNNGGGGQAPPSIGFAYRRTPRSVARIRPRGLGVTGGGDNDAGGDGSNGNNSSMPPPSSSRLLSEGSLTPAGKSGILSPNAYLSGGVKRLNIPTDTEERLRLRFSAQRPLIRPATPPVAGGSGGPRRSVAIDNGNADANDNGSAGVEETKGGGGGVATSDATPRGGGVGGRSASSPEGSTRPTHRALAGLTSPPPSGGVGTDVRAAAGGADESLVLDGSPGAGAGAGASQLFPEGNGDGIVCGGPPRLDLDDYGTTPTMAELATMSDDALRAVADFEVVRDDIGSIKWKEPVDIRGLDIGRVVAIEPKSASVYDDLREGEEKPPVGEGLNKPTLVTLMGLFPKGDNPTDEQKRRYEARVRRNTDKSGAKLVNYNVETGVWKFETLHWSRYAMDDSDDEDEGGVTEETRADATSKSTSNGLMPPPPPGRIRRVHGQTPSTGGDKTAVAPVQFSVSFRRSTKYSMPDTDDEGSVADSVGDAGGAMMAAADARDGDADSMKAEMKAWSDGQNADMVDAADAPAAGDAGSDDVWANAPRATDSDMFLGRDPSQAEHMRSRFDEEGRDKAGRGVGDASRGPEGLGVRGARAFSQQQSSAWLPLPPPLLPRGPALADPADAEAAANFRPILAGPQSRVLRLLGNAWKPTLGEVADGGTRGAVRAGRTVADLGLRCGKGFRVSWGPCGQLVVPGAIGGGGGVPGAYTVKVVQFDPTPAASGRSKEELYLAPLRNHRRFAKSVPQEEWSTGPPRWALPRRGIGAPGGYEALVSCMHGYAATHASSCGVALAEESGGGRNRTVEDSPEWVLEQSWRLASAMWGQEKGEGRAQDLPMPGGVWAADVGAFDGASPAARREAAVTEWLAKAVAACVPESMPGVGRVASNKTAGDGPGEGTWRRLLELLSVRRIGEAARTAATAGLPRLAVVLSAAATQGIGGPGGRYACRALSKQARLWEGGDGGNAYMLQEAFSVYQLLGREGFRDVHLRGVIGKGSSSSHPSLDWLRQLGLCLWFGAGATAGSHNGSASGIGDVAAAVQAYESLVADNEALPPIARYFREPTHHDKTDLDQVGEELRRVHVAKGNSLGSGGTAAPGRDRCVLSRLLAMYPRGNLGGGGDQCRAAGGGASGVALLAALEPMAVTPDVMDYRHSWHLMSVVEALGVAEVPDRAKAAAVAEALRFQLVSAGLWEWAVYVALTAEGDAESREATARELVLRHGHGLLAAPCQSVDEARRDLLNGLRVPEAWLYEAAAVRAGYDHRSALPTPKRCVQKLAASSIVNREVKLELLVSAKSAELARDAAKEACLLAPGSMYRGGVTRTRLTKHFEDIARQLDVGGTRVLSCYPGVRAVDGFRRNLFDAYKDILDAAEQDPPGVGGWSRDEVERLERLRRVVQPTAAKVVGAAVAHEALASAWKEAGLAT